MQILGILASYCNLPGPFGMPQISRKFSSFAIKPRSDSIWDTVLRGDIELVKWQFQNGLAAPTDRSPAGVSLLHVSPNLLLTNGEPVN